MSELELAWHGDSRCGGGYNGRGRSGVARRAGRFEWRHVSGGRVGPGAVGFGERLELVSHRRALDSVDGDGVVWRVVVTVYLDDCGVDESVGSVIVYGCAFGYHADGFGRQRRWSWCDGRGRGGGAWSSGVTGGAVRARGARWSLSHGRGGRGVSEGAYPTARLPPGGARSAAG